MTKTTSVLVKNLGFPEAPRWHDNKLWFSDFRTRKVSTTDEQGQLKTVLELDDQPSGLGWLPCGSMLVVSMKKRLLLKCKAGSVTTLADLNNLASYHCNDMVVTPEGNAYLGNFGAPLETPVAKTAELILVTKDGNARVVADDLAFPNGCVITPDGKTLIVGETYAGRLTAFDIQPDGSLSNRRAWAEFDDLGIVRDADTMMERINPDGICLDAEGAIWVASPNNRREVVRVKEGGEITDRVTVETFPYACMLGGSDGCTLFVLTSDLFKPGLIGQIETVTVAVPGAGFP